jgi:hypothetical protein
MEGSYPFRSIDQQPEIANFTHDSLLAYYPDSYPQMPILSGRTDIDR